MAVIKPFKGIVYNPDKINNPADVCTPPYDVISPQEQQGFYDRHPKNIVRLDFGKKTENDTEKENPFTRAAGYFDEWLSDGTLVEDEKPAIYLTSVEFQANGQTVVRYGMIVLVKIEPFEKGVILPHEKTFSKVRSERFNLMKSCGTNFSPIFSLYSDADNTILNRMKEKTMGKAADLDFVDSQGLKQCMWKITDESLLESTAAAMADKIIYIADGHHRYETALNYRNWVSEKNTGFSENHPANYVMMYLSCMDEPGLLIFSAHRLLTGLDQKVVTEFVDRSKPFFNITSFPYNNDNRDSVRNEFYSSLESSNAHQTIGVGFKNRKTLYLLKAKPHIMERLFADEIPQSLINLDVTVLTRLVFMKILGFDMARLDNEKLINYTSIWEEALDRIEREECEAAFILNPTKMEQVKEVAEAGLIMPRKSTYFYPKVVTGQVINKLF